MKVENENTVEWNGSNGCALHLVPNFIVIMSPILVVVLLEKYEEAGFVTCLVRSLRIQVHRFTVVLDGAFCTPLLDPCLYLVFEFGVYFPVVNYVMYRVDVEKGQKANALGMTSSTFSGDLLKGSRGLPRRWILIV